MHLDTTTLLYALWAMTAMAAMGLLLGLDAAGMRALRRWFLALTLHAGGWLCALAAQAHDSLPLEALSVTLLTLGLLFIHAAVARFLHVPAPHVLWRVMPVALGITTWLAGDGFAWRQSMTNGVIAAQILLICGLLWMHRTSASRWHRLALIALLMTVPFAVSRVFELGPASHWLLGQQLTRGFDDVGFLVDVTSVVLLNMAFLLAYGQEAQSKLTILANRDALSGLLNRRAWSELTERTLVEHDGSTPAAVMLLDLDHFKKINDTHGHAIGDLAIKCLGDSTRQTLRDHDIIGRYGGEEFSIYLPNIPSDALVAVDQRLRSHFRNSTQRRIDMAVTYSAGVAMLRPHESLESAMLRADVALYEAKRSGRDRLVFAPDA